MKGIHNNLSIIDLGAGINGLSYNFFNEAGFNVSYTGVEAMGQLVDLMNDYFKKNNLNGSAIHLSLLELEKIKQIIKKTEKPRVVFLFKTIDSLELLERHSSKRLLLEVAPLVDKIVVSFATRSLIRKEKFKWDRKWLINFIKYNFNLIDDFKIGSERYIVFEGR